jgi:predicted TIM-barrel fold metal-dependent hydrolase
MLFHCGSYRYHVRRRPAHQYATPLRFEPLLAAFPQVTFVLAHLGLHESNDALAVAGRHENVILETSFQHRTILQRAFAAVGASRLVFGSDFPGSNIAAPLREIMAAAPSTGDLELALWRNAERLLRLPAA